MLANPIVAADVFEQAWNDLRLFVKGTTGLVPVVLFCAASAPITELCRRLADTLRFRACPVETLAPGQPSDLDGPVLSRLLAADNPLAGTGAPLWLDLQCQPQEDGWGKARAAFLTQLIAQQAVLETTFRRPLIVALPVSERDALAPLLPDAWRRRVINVPAGDGARGATNSGTGASQSAASAAQTTSAQPVRREQLPALVMQWRETVERLAPEQIVLQDGFAAFDAAIAARNIKAAEEVAKKTMAIAVARPHDSLVAIRELARAHDQIGDVASQFGHIEEAGNSYREALVLRQRLHAELPGPQTARELSLSWNRVGDAAVHLDRLDEAEQAYNCAHDLR